MPITVVAANQLTEGDESDDFEHLIEQHKSKHIAFIFQDDLFLVHDIDEDGQIYATCANGEYIEINHKVIEQYIFIGQRWEDDLSN